MPTILYQEIVTPEVSESGLVKHEWKYKHDSNVCVLYHIVDGECVDKFAGGLATKMWSQLCRSK